MTQRAVRQCGVPAALVLNKIDLADPELASRIEARPDAVD
jgi:hypothetical protein